MTYFTPEATHRLDAYLSDVRAALTVARESGTPLGARRWLIYPPLVLVSLFVGLVAFLWPIAPAAAAADDLWRHYQSDLLGAVNLPRGLAEAGMYTVTIASALAAWWVVLGTVLTVAPRLVEAVFRPFADGFGRRQAGALVLTGLGVLAVCLGLFVRVMNGDGYYVHSPRLEAPSRVVHVASAE
jgi:hypothetical protein